MDGIGRGSRSRPGRRRVMRRFSGAITTVLVVAGVTASCGSNADDSSASDTASIASDTEASLGEQSVVERPTVGCPEITVMGGAIDAFLNDALDGVPGQMPGPDEMKAILDSMRESAGVVQIGAEGEVAVAAGSIVDASDRFATFLEGYGYDLRQFDYSGDTPIDGDLNAIIDTMDFETIDAAMEAC